MPDPAARRITCTLERHPFGWRSPQFQPLVLGMRVDKRGRKVPRVRLKPYPVAEMEGFQRFAIPRLTEARALAGMDAGTGTSPEDGFLRGPVALRLRAIVACPRHLHRIRAGTPRRRSTRKPDLTNIVKLVEDCCTSARWWRDDAAVAEQRNDAWVQETPPHRCAKGVPCPVIDRPRVQVVAWELEPREE